MLGKGQPQAGRRPKPGTASSGTAGGSGGRVPDSAIAPGAQHQGGRRKAQLPAVSPALRCLLSCKRTFGERSA